MRFVKLVRSLLAGLLPPVGRLPGRAGAANARSFRAPALLLLAAALFLAWIFLVALYTNVVKVGFFLRRPEIVFFAAALLSWLVSFFSGLSAARALFAAPAGDALLRSLPYRPFTVAAARMIALYLLLLPLALFLFAPAFVVYLQITAADARAAAGIAVDILVLPLVPAALAAALVLALRRLPRYAPWVAAVNVAGLALLVLGLALLQTALQQALVTVDRNVELIFPVELAVFLGRLQEVFPPAAWAASVFRPGEEIRSALFSIILAAVVIAPVLWLGARSGASDEKNGDRTMRHPPRRRPAFRQTGPLTACVRREASTFLDRPDLLSEAALRLLALPLFLLIYAAAGPRELTALFAGFVSSSPWAGLAVVAALIFLGDVSFLAAVGLSREAGRFGVSLLAPVDGALQVKAKLVFLLCLALPAAAASLTLLYFLFPLPAETLVCAVPGIVAYFVFTIAVGLLLDLRRPELRDKGAAYHLSPAVVLSAAAGAAVLALFGALAAAAYFIGLSPLAAGFLCVILLVAADIAILPRLLNYATRRYAFELEA